MAEKDIAERALVSRESVLADLINVYRYDGERVVKAKDIRILEARSPTRIYGDIGEETRDVLISWEPKDESRKKVSRAHFGFEIQTAPDKYMALRIAGYDGADYHAQHVNYTSTEAKGINKVKANRSLVSVYTYVLYFGLTPWNAPTSLGKALSPATLSNDDPEGFNDLNYPVIEVAFATPKQIKAMQSDFKYIASIMVELQKLYSQKGVKVDDLDLSDLLHVLRNQPKLTYRIDVERLLEAMCEDPRRSTKEDTPAHKTASLFIYQVFNRVCDDPSLGDDNVVTELFPNLQKRVGGRVFWQGIARLVLAGADEQAILNVMDPDGSMRAMYPRPNNFPDCFATTQPQPATPKGGGPVIRFAGAMSPDAQ